MLAATLHAPISAGDRRIADRPDLVRAGTIRVGNAPADDIVVLDLTREGCRIETEAVLPEDGVFAIGLGGVGITMARPVWRNARGYGCEFIESLPPGAITAAFQSTNVAAFPLAAGTLVQSNVTSDAKWSARATVALVVSAAVTSWATLTMVALALR